MSHFVMVDMCVGEFRLEPYVRRRAHQSETEQFIVKPGTVDFGARTFRLWPFAELTPCFKQVRCRWGWRPEGRAGSNR